MRSDSSGVKVDNTVISLYLSHLKLLSLQTGKVPQARQLLSRSETRCGLAWMTNLVGFSEECFRARRSSRGFLSG
jgi:hypothetical protein